MSGKVVRVAIVGLGHIGQTHITALRASPGLELVAACDREPQLSTLAPENVSFFECHHTMLRQGNFDTVIVATPNSSHNAIAADALAAGFHVIIEKPAGTSLDELDALEQLACETGRHVYYAFHAAAAKEVEWLNRHLQDDGASYGPITGFFSRFFDPYIGTDGSLVSHAASLGDCWSDSGVNALSVLDMVLPVERLRAVASYRSGAGGDGSRPSSVTAQFAFPVNGVDCSGLGVVATAWDQGLNVKCTELYFGRSGWRLTLDHSGQSVTADAPDGSSHALASFGGDRLINHYHGVFADYCERFKTGNMNSEAARRIHACLFGAVEP